MADQPIPSETQPTKETEAMEDTSTDPPPPPSSGEASADAPLPPSASPVATDTSSEEIVEKSTTQKEEFAEKRQSQDVFALLNAHPETKPTIEEKIHQEKPEWVRIQEKTFTKWANHHLQGKGHPPIQNLQEDMKDGVALIVLLESLTKKEIGRKYHKEPKTHIQMMDNLQVAFQFMESEGLEHTSMNPADISNGNVKLILAILWRFIFKYHISAPIKSRKISITKKVPPSTPSEEGAPSVKTIQEEKEMTPEEILLSWFQASLPQFQIRNFTSDWNDGIKLSALVNYCRPGLIPNWNQKDPKNATENLQNAISLAQEHFGIPEIVHAEDLARAHPDKPSVMTYLTYFCCPGSPGEQCLMEWILTVIPETNITNFCRDWKDGHALCALVGTFAPSAIDMYDLEDHSNLENTCTGMEAAEEQFGIKPLLSPEEFISPDIDQLSVMAYLTQFRFIQEERWKLPFLSIIGSGVTGVQVGEEAELQIEGEELEEEDVVVRVTSPDSSLVQVQPIPRRETSPTFYYKPTIPGTYTVEVKYSGEHIKGSPYSVAHIPPLDSVTDGRGLYQACVGLEAEFTVECSTLGKGMLSARITDQDDDPLDVVLTKEEGDDVYRISYVPQRIGKHTIQLAWDCSPDSEEETDGPITTFESSYTPTIFDASKCVVVGDGLTQASIGEPAYFQVKTSEAGSGSLSATITGPGNPEMKLLSFDDFEYSYEYTPEDGPLQVDIKWENIPIPGSPFTVTPVAKTPASKCTIKEKPKSNVRVCTPVSVIVSTADAEIRELKAILTGPDTNKECNIVQIERDIHAITFCPITIGRYNLSITYDSIPIPGTPIHMEVNDPTKCQVVNPDVLVGGSWQCGQQVLVRVATEEAGKGNLVGKVHGPTQSITCRTTEEEAGNRLVCFTPTETGQHSIELYFDGYNLEEPKRITVQDDSLEGITITKPVSQSGYHLASKELEIRMFAPSRDEMLFTIEACGIKTKSAPTCKLVPTGEDTYIISFAATEPDDYRVTISYNGKRIPGSPFTLIIRTPACPENVKSFDPVLPLVAGGEPIELFFNVAEAGVGTLTANVTDSSSDDWFQLVNIEEVLQDVHCVSFVPPKSDGYSVSVFWSGKHIPGSPLAINYKEQEKVPPVSIQFEPDVALQGVISATAVGRSTGAVNTTVRQYKRGHYQITFEPLKREKYALQILCFDAEIRGSPFTVDLTPSIPTKLPPGVNVVSVPVSLNGPGLFSAFAVSEVSGLVRPMYLSVPMSKKHVQIDFTARKRDLYELYVFWNQQLVPGSPFRVDLRPSDM